MLAYLLCGSTEMIFLTMSASPSFVNHIELSSLIIRFKREYMSLTSSFSFAIPGGVDSWALDPFGPGERVTLGQGLVNQQVTPLVEVSDPFSLPRLHLWNTPNRDFALFPAIFTLRHTDSLSWN
jgi:hypothetical protein